MRNEESLKRKVTAELGVCGETTFHKLFLSKVFKTLSNSILVEDYTVGYVRGIEVIEIWYRKVKSIGGSQDEVSKDVYIRGAYGEVAKKTNWEHDSKVMYGEVSRLISHHVLEGLGLNDYETRAVVWAKMRRMFDEESIRVGE
jgi:hypothetical protein